jgi:hypothetical protein
MKMPNTKRVFFSVLLCFFMVSSAFQALALSDHPTLKARIDLRIELLYIIDATANASSWHNCQLMNTVYHQQVIKHFTSYCDHDAISYYKAFIEDKLDFNILERAFLSLPPSQMPDHVEAPKEWSAELGIFVQKALDFYHESAFQNFMLRQSSIIREIESSYQAVLNRQTWQETFFEWFSPSMSQFSILISPLKKSSHQGYLVPMSDMSLQYYLVLGLTAISNGFLVFAGSSELQTLVLQDVSNDLVRTEMKLFPEELCVIEQHMLAYESTWKDLGFSNSTDFIAHQMALCMYWRFSDELNQDQSSDHFLQEAEEAGYFLIISNWKILQDFVQNFELKSWKAYTPLYLKELSSVISQLSTPKQ